MGQEKNLSKMDVFGSSFIMIISSGIFLLPFFLYPKAGFLTPLAYGLAGFFFLIAIFSYKNIIDHFLKTGENYFLFYRNMSSFLASLNGITLFFSMILKGAFALFGLAYTLSLFSSFSFFVWAFIVLAILILFQFLKINYQALKNLLGMVLVLLVVVFFIKGVFVLHWQKIPDFSYNNNLFSFFFYTAFVFVSYGGVQNIMGPIQKLKDSKTTLSSGFFYAILGVILIYVFTSWLMGAFFEQSSNFLILAQTVQKIHPYAYFIFAIAGGIAFFITAESSLFSAVYYLQSLSKDRLMPNIFKKSFSLNAPPYFTIVFSALLMFLPLFLKPFILIVLASSSVILLALLFCFSFIALKEKKSLIRLPFAKIKFYPLAQIIAILFFIFFLFQLGFYALILVGTFVILSLILWVFYGKNRNLKELELFYLTESLLSPRLTSKLQFKHLYKNLSLRLKKQKALDAYSFLVLDLPKKTDLPTLFEIVSEQITKDLPLTSYDFFELLLECQENNTMLVNSFVAVLDIPFHLQDKKIVIIRCKPGVFFSLDAPLVQSIIIVVGDKNNPLWHLKQVGIISLKILSSTFEEQWIKAKSSEDLKKLFA